MKEPSTLADHLHVLETMGGGTYIITREQALMITAAQNSGTIKTFSIGNCPVSIHQVTGMPTLDVYRLQKKTSLAEKHQRMCRRCGAILAMQDRCSCRENEEPSVIEVAAKQNPKLKQYLLDAGLEALALPEPKVPELPEAPPTPKERAQMKEIQRQKDRFLGRTRIELPDCVECKNERRYLFKGVMVNCDCTISSAKPLQKEVSKGEQSGTLKSVPPSL